MPDIDFKQLPFDEAISFFRKKINMPTARWSDVLKESHDRAFTVAGAMQEDLLKDIRESIDIALADGLSIERFREDFDDIVARHGWSYKGNRGWRTGVIFNTNMSVAYSIGQYQSIFSDKENRPYMRYIGGLSENPRPLHLKWDGLVLPIDDPWWDTHMPPNGWGCKCVVVSQSGSEIKRDNRIISKKGPDDGTFKWKNPSTGAIMTIPAGIDPGWDYHPGKTGFRDA